MRRFSVYLVFSLFLLLGIGGFLQESQAQQQVRALSTKPPAGQSYVLQKEVPDRTPPAVSGNGLPTALYVVQLARFEEMRNFPEKFPQGTMLWQNPDIPTEKFLLAGFYGSFAEASQAAREWKKNKMFPGAFALKEPFMIRYD